MSRARKLALEVETTLKKIHEGVQDWQSEVAKLSSIDDSAQATKLTDTLKRDLKKLQKLRDSVRGWLAEGSCPGKEQQLIAGREEVESCMMLFKDIEKSVKIKPFSRAALDKDDVDPLLQAKLNCVEWLNETSSQLESQIEQFEADLEVLGPKAAKSGNSQAAQLKKYIQRHKEYLTNLDRVLRLLENDQVTAEEVESALKDSMEYYLESCTDPDFVEDEMMFDALPLDEVVAAVGKFTHEVKQSTTYKLGGGGETPVSASATDGSSDKDDGISTPSLDDTRTPAGKKSGKGGVSSTVSKPSKKKGASKQQISTPVAPIVEKKENDVYTHVKASTMTAERASSGTSSITMTPKAATGGVGTNLPLSFKDIALANQQQEETPPPPIASVDATPRSPTGVVTSAIDHHPLGGLVAEEAEGRTEERYSPTKLTMMHPSPVSLLPPPQAAVQHMDHKDLEDNLLGSAASNTPGGPLDALGHVMTPPPTGAQLPSPPPPTTQGFYPTTSTTTTGTPQPPSTTSILGSGFSTGRVPTEMLPTAPSPIMPPSFGNFTTEEDSMPHRTPFFAASQRAAVDLQHGTNTFAPNATPSPQHHPAAALYPTNNYTNLSNQTMNGSGSYVNRYDDNYSTPTQASDAYGAGLISSVLLDTSAGAHNNTVGLNDLDALTWLGGAVPGDLSLRVPTTREIDCIDAVINYVPRNIDAEWQSSNPSLTDDYTNNKPLPGEWKPAHKVPTPPSWPTSVHPTLNSYNHGMKKLQLETLFFAFYYQVGTRNQLMAAAALKELGWRFHKGLGAWFARSNQPTLVTANFEQGAMVYFDWTVDSQVGEDGNVAHGWVQRLTPSEFMFHYSEMENEVLVV